MYQIDVKVRFRAGHRLMEPYVGKCNNVHGEGFTTTVCIKTEKLQADGTLLDFGEVKRYVKDYLNRNFDHHFLCRNDDPIGELLANEGMAVTFTDTNPTSENIAKEIYDVVSTWLAGKFFGGDDVVYIKVGIQESFEDAVAWYTKAW